MSELPSPDTTPPAFDWDPLSPQVLADQRAAYDAMRERCPVAHSQAMHWSVLRHADVLRVLQDHDRFSSIVSEHQAVPNGFDPPEHDAYRAALDPLLSAERVQRFEPACRELALQAVHDALSIGDVEVHQEFALPYAVRVQSAFLGWPHSVQDELLAWLARSHAATRSGERAQTQAVAREFEDLVGRVREARASAPPEQDISTELMHVQVRDVHSGQLRRLDLHELASVLRNWTVGEVGTISASVGIILHWLASHPDWQQRLRDQPALLPPAIDEMLRIDGPLVANRRRTSCPVTLGGRDLPAGARVSVNWVAANRDPRAFDAPDAFRLDRDPQLNLLYGAGIHICPGAALARMELRVLIDAVLSHTTRITLTEDQTPTRAAYPDAGYARLRVRLK